MPRHVAGAAVATAVEEAADATQCQPDRHAWCCDIDDNHELRTALRELVPHLAHAAGDDPVTKAEDDLRGKALPGFFPTPRRVIEQMLDLAGIEQTHRVLEPSCGKGDILDGNPQHEEARGAYHVDTAGLAMRSRPAVDAPLLTKLGGGDTVTVIEFIGDWAHVRLPDGREGYVVAKFLLQD